MKKFKLDHVLLLFIIIVIEGYVVLSTELLAIRQTIPFVGSGTDTVSIIIAAVLLPLAVGYYRGGKFKRGWSKDKKKYLSVRRKLITNILIASAILLVGMSYIVMNIFFGVLLQAGLDNRIILTTLYSLLFIVGPVYLLGQTIPLVSNFFSHEKLSQITGRMLFFSTVGSFLGAVFSTLVLMATIGVHYTVALNFVLLAILVALLSRRKRSETVFLACFMALTGLVLNSGEVMSSMNIVSNNQYNTTSVYTDEDGARHLIMNSNSSSMYSDDGRKHTYIEFAERQLLRPIADSPEEKDILIIGAGAFTFGFEDPKHRYVYIDIDKSLRTISEEYILKDELKPNKEFLPMEARAYLAKTDKKFDVIFLDAYLGDRTIPEHLVTREFFQQVREHLTPSGIVAANFIVSPDFNSKFSRHIDNTWRAVFPHSSRHVIGENYNLWNDDLYATENVIYMFRAHDNADPDHQYSDNKNTIFYDKPQKR